MVPEALRSAVGTWGPPALGSALHTHHPFPFQVGSFWGHTAAKRQPGDQTSLAHSPCPLWGGVFLSHMDASFLCDFRPFWPDTICPAGQSPLPGPSEAALPPGAESPSPLMDPTQPAPWAAAGASITAP